jgi:hypothetical protein
MSTRSRVSWPMLLGMDPTSNVLHIPRRVSPVLSQIQRAAPVVYTTTPWKGTLIQLEANAAALRAPGRNILVIKRTQLHGSVCTCAPHFPSAHSLYIGSRLKCCHASQSLEEIFTELTVQALGGAPHAIAQAGRNVRMCSCCSEGTGALAVCCVAIGARAAVEVSPTRAHSSLTHPSQRPTGFNQGLQQVSHTSHPKNVWLHTRGCSQGATEEAPVGVAGVASATGMTDSITCAATVRGNHFAQVIRPQALPMRLPL